MPTPSIEANSKVSPKKYGNVGGRESRQSLQPSSMLPPIAKPAVGSIEPMRLAKQNKYIQNTPNVSKSINDNKSMLISRNDNRMSLQD